MGSEQDMMSDLAAADAAGDHELAQHIAGKIKASRAGAPPTVSGPMAALQGAAQGATLGWGDEMKAGWRSLFPGKLGGAPYKKGLAEERAYDESAQKQHPYLHGAGNFAGSVLPSAAAAVMSGGTSLAPTMARMALPLAAGQGAMQGAGYSNADTPGGLARDSAVGGGLGILGHGIGTALGAVGRFVSGRARGLAVRAEAKAAEKAANEVSEQLASARGSLGGEVQKGQRIVENLRRLGVDLSPEEQAAATQLEQRLAQSTREALPAQVGAIASKDAELAALKTGASDAFHARKDALLSTGEMKNQILTRALRYGPVAAGSVLGNIVGGPIGGTVGSLAGAGTRPMVRSVLRMAKNPAVQKAAGEFVENRVNGPTATFLRRALQAGIPAEATQQLVTQ